LSIKLFSCEILGDQPSWESRSANQYSAAPPQFKLQAGKLRDLEIRPIAPVSVLAGADWKDLVASGYNVFRGTEVQYGIGALLPDASI
jgi:hypothetical protein